MSFLVAYLALVFLSVVTLIAFGLLLPRFVDRFFGKRKMAKYRAMHHEDRARCPMESAEFDPCISCMRRRHCRIMTNDASRSKMKPGGE